MSQYISVSPKRNLVALVVACTVATLAVPAARAQDTVEHVVVESNSVQYQVGQILDSGTMLALNRGQFVVLIAATGDKVRVEGPYLGLPPHEARIGLNLLASLVRLIDGGAPQLGGLGADRGPGGGSDAAAEADLRPSPWLIHADRSGLQCYVRERETQFWRNDPDSAVDFELRDVGSGATAKIHWADNAHEAAWPAALPPRSGNVYTVRRLNRLSSGTTIRVLSLEPGAADDPQAAAAWLAARGCRDQARIALAALGVR